MGDWDVVSTEPLAPKKGDWDVVSHEPTQPPAMFLSLPDASGKMHAEPTTRYNMPEERRGIGTRMHEGANQAMEGDLGFSQENLKRYPWLNWLQPAAKAADVTARQPGVVIGGLAGLGAGALEPVIGRTSADTLQGELQEMPNAFAAEMPSATRGITGLSGHIRDIPDVLRRDAEEVAPSPTPPPGAPPAPVSPEVPRQVVRPEAGVDLLPTDVPHELPPQRRALSANGAGGPLAGMSPETIAHMRAVMEEQGFTPHTIDQRLEEMSAHHFFGEITPSLEADMGAVAAPPGPGKLEVMGSLRQRALEAVERVRQQFDRSFGVNENVAQLRRIMEGDRQRAAAPFYEKFRNTVITPTPEIEALMPRLEASGALREANRSLTIEGEPLTHGFLDVNDPPGLTRVPTASAFQYAKEALDDMIGKAIKGGEMNAARRYVGIKNALVDALDNHPAVGDVWKQARNEYATPTTIINAMKFGREVLTGKIDREELPFLTAAYSPAEMKAMRIGMRSYLENSLGRRDVLTADTINTVLSPNNIQKLRWAIGDEAAETLVTAMDHERHMHTAPTRIHGGSPTALRQEAQKRWTVQPGMFDKIGLADVAGAVTSPVKTGIHAAAGAAERFGLSQRRAAKEARMARVREEASRIFTLQGPERDAVARYLVGGEDVTRKRGGRVIRKAAGGAAGNNAFLKARAKYAAKGYADGGSPELSEADQAAMSPETFANPLAKLYLKRAINTLAIPGRALQSREPITTEEMIEPAMDLSGMVMLGGAPMPGEAGALRAGLKTRIKKGTGDAEAAAAGAEEKAGVDVGRGLAGATGGGEGLQQAALQAERRAAGRQPLPGLPTKAQSINGEPFVPGPVGAAHDVAERYMADKDFGRAPPDKYHPIDVEHAKDIAQAFEDMPHTPHDPDTKAAYDALIRETLAQYQAIKESGLKITPTGAADYPYKTNPREVVKDVADNNHMAFFKTSEGFGPGEVPDPDHPMLRPSGEKIGEHELLNNDLFRIVHDYFGHVKNGYGFRGPGEDNAWRAHAAMYSPEARRAMTTETRGQNSWLNYGPHGEFNRTANAEDTIYAKQKMGLLPEWTMEDRVASPAIHKGSALLVDEQGLPIHGKNYTKAQKEALDEIKAGPKGAGPLDLSTQNRVPQVPQEAMERYEPPRGVSERLQAALDDPKIRRGIMKSIEAGKAMGADKWYHTEPIRRAFVEKLGLEDGLRAFAKYMDHVAATSPRSAVPENIRNASYQYLHALNDRDLPEKLPYPYGHFAQKQHRENYATLRDEGSWDALRNPKPASFSQNLQGNLVPVTVDTHAFRNIGMRTQDPRFLETRTVGPRAEGKDTLAARFGEPSGDDKVVYRPQHLVERGKLSMKEAEEIPAFWAAQPNENEYGAAEGLYRSLAKKAGLAPADAQAAAWSGAGKMTGLGSPPTHTFPEMFNERVLFTAKMRGERPEKVLHDFIKGKKPLLSHGGSVPKKAGGGATGTEPTQREDLPPSAGDDTGQGDITAYHGSPYDFDRFDISKIGSGEGQQVYGHGLYFADKEGVAQRYRDALQKTVSPHLTLDGERVTPSMLRDMKTSGDDNDRWLAQQHYDRLLSRSKGSYDKFFEDLQKETEKRDYFLQRARDQRANPPLASTYSPEDLEMFAANRQRQIDHLTRAIPRLEQKLGGPSGKMYEVGLNVDPEHLLDWDARFKDQSRYVQNKAAPLMEKSVKDQREVISRILSRGTSSPVGFGRPLNDAERENYERRLQQADVDSLTGQQIYTRFGLPATTQSEGYRRSAMGLDREGIPGLRYDDQMSRPAADVKPVIDEYGTRQKALVAVRRQLVKAEESGSGDYMRLNGLLRELSRPESHNYVMFNDKLIDIKRKYRVGGDVGPYGGAVNPYA
jgi:hypothetical protein